MDSLRLSNMEEIRNYYKSVIAVYVGRAMATKTVWSKDVNPKLKDKDFCDFLLTMRNEHSFKFFTFLNSKYKRSYFVYIKDIAKDNTVNKFIDELYRSYQSIQRYHQNYQYD